jgi:hypothetical protein
MPLTINANDDTYAYIYGGQNTVGVSHSSFEKYNMTTDVSTLDSATITEKKMGAVPFKDSTYIYFGPGFTNDLAISNTVQKMNMTTNVVANKTTFLTIPTGVSQTIYNSTDAYICFGIGIPHNNTYSVMEDMFAGRIEKMSFATEVTSVIEAWTGQNLGTSPAGSI